MLGLIALTTSYPSPNRSTAPGAKFSVKTSAFFTISLTSASPRSDFRLTVCDRLLAFYIMKYYASPKPVRPASPPLGFSTLAMSAPIQASASVQVVPASNCVRSSTRIPVRQPGDAGVTSIVDSFSGGSCHPAKAGPGQAAVVPLDSRFADQPSRTYPNRPLPVLSEFDYMRDWSCLCAGGRRIRTIGSSKDRKVDTRWLAVCHPALRSIERYAGDAAALGQQFFLSPEVGRYRVRRTRALMIKIPTARLRQLVLARGKPRLGYASLMQIVRR